MAALLDKPAASLRSVAEQLGVSRSFVQRRAALLYARTVRSICTPEREEAGAAPLPPHHPISWDAIALPLHA